LIDIYKKSITLTDMKNTTYRILTQAKVRADAIYMGVHTSANVINTKVITAGRYEVFMNRDDIDDAITCARESMANMLRAERRLDQQVKESNARASFSWDD
jgi:DNA-directed RNA polymerase subunit K/omega